MAKTSNYWVKVRYEKEIRVHVVNEEIAKVKAMHDFLTELPNISEKDLRIIHVETSEDRK
mgnify:CR=1 FL=1|jgi:hypothetical protein